MEPAAIVQALLEAARTRPAHTYWHELGRERLRLALHPEEAVALLAPALSDPVPAVRRFAARLLRELAHERARQALRVALADSDEEVRLEATGALLGEPLPPPGWDAPAPPVPAALRAALVAALLPLVGARRQFVFESAVRMLVRLGATEVLAAARARLPDPDWNFSSRVFLALERVPGGADVLRELAGHPDAETRAGALRSLVRLRAEPAVARELPALVLAALADPVARVRGAAAHAAGVLGLAPAETALLRMLGGTEDREAVTALGALRSEAALPSLIERARTASEAQSTAIAAIACFEPRVAIEDALLEILASPADAYVKLAAATAIASHGTARAVPALEQFRRAARGLAKRSRKPALRKLPEWIELARARPPWPR